MTAAADAARTKAGHSIWVVLLGELIGVSLMAVFADMNKDLGKIMVALMAGWFLVFLMVNASELHALIGKVSNG